MAFNCSKVHRLSPKLANCQSSSSRAAASSNSAALLLTLLSASTNCGKKETDCLASASALVRLSVVTAWTLAMTASMASVMDCMSRLQEWSTMEYMEIVSSVIAFVAGAFLSATHKIRCFRFKSRLSAILNEKGPSGQL